MRSLVYIHVPKCGGTSFGSALRLRYFYSQSTISLTESRTIQRALYPRARGAERIKAEYDIRDVMLAHLLARGVRCISAHTRYHPDLHHLHKKQANFVTLLRDPVDRFLSHYHYLQHHHPDPARAPSLDSFLETQDAARIGAQYLFYFGRALAFETNDLYAAIRAAQDALGRFALIGDLSRAQSFHSELNRISGIPIPVVRRNTARQSIDRPDGDLLVRLRDICSPDIAIYEHAQTLRGCV